MADAENGAAGDPNLPEEKIGRAQRKILSRRQILDAAKVVFFRDGFMAANLDEVAENAGVAKGTLYRYFESKADLYVAVLADNGDGFTQRLEEAVAGGERGLEKLERLSQFYYDYWIRHPEYFQIFWAIDNQSVIGELPPEVVAEVSKLWEQNLSILSKVVKRAMEEGDLVDCDPWEVAQILWTTANALIQADSIQPRRELRRLPLEQVFQHAIRYLLRGLAAPGSKLLG
ncbi:MAG: TetR/AcrR family transcriptional regulator [Myxococcota bacterium]|nr:TetR/AcrR family transcriptional regulator [Myxococcota bacterium]